jgi:hypothetical protein
VKISTRQKRTIIIGFGIIALLALVYALTLQQPETEGLADMVDLKKKMLLKQRETILREGIYEVQLQQYQKRLEDNRTRLLPGDNPNIAGAELLNILKGFADSSGVEFIQTNVLKEERVEDLLLKISVQITTSCDMKQLVQFLTAIENYDKFLTVDDLMIRSQNQRNEDMRPRLTVSGYIHSSEIKTVEGARATKL